ncbi:MAG: sulfotransferase [Candidatus Eremiobacterales bacterium]
MSYFYRNTLGARIRRRLSAIQHSFYLDVNPDHRATVLLAGSGRSGTTWLADVINHDNAYRYVAEPFTREHVNAVRHFARLQYIRPDDEGEEYFEAVRSILEGRVRSPWADNSNRCVIARKRLVKDVRCTLMLAWMIRRFAGMPVVFIRRHPLAVAHSRCRAHWRVRKRDVYFNQPELMADHLEPFREVLTSAGTEIEGHVVDWCVENIVPQRQLTDRQACFVDYENIVVDREAEFRRIFTFIGKPFDPRALDRSTNLSATTFLGRDGAKRRATREMRSWRDVMSAEEIRGAMEIVKRFGLDHLCKEGSEERRAAPARA